ncbi:MAG TPA: hypothetical protein VNO21_20705 [Polyangiaceae bacterium]|nr:hypothetical protein [Polyangiaceae bacterium]
MKRSLGFIIITASLGVGLCAFVYRAVHIRAETPAAASGTQRVAEGGPPASAELAKMREEIASLQRQVSSQRQMPVAEPVKAEADAKDLRTDSEMRAEGERKHREYMAGVEAAFRNETIDARWSPATSSVVQTAISADNALRALTRDVECRSSTCRVEIADDGSGSLGKALPMLALQVGPALPSVSSTRVEDGSGASTMVLYMSRQNESP